MNLFRNMIEADSVGNVTNIQNYEKLSESDQKLVHDVYQEAYLSNQHMGIIIARGVAFETAKIAVNEAHEGFKKLKAELAHKKGVTDAGALTAWIGRKKYGKEAFDKMSETNKDSETIQKDNEKDKESKEDGLGESYSVDSIMKQLDKEALEEKDETPVVKFQGVKKLGFNW